MFYPAALAILHILFLFLLKCMETNQAIVAFGIMDVIAWKFQRPAVNFSKPVLAIGHQKRSGGSCNKWIWVILQDLCQAQAIFFLA